MEIPGFRRPSGDDFAYVEAAHSRRTGGLALDVDLAPSHRCNFACIYCSVTDLARGEGAQIDLERLRDELREALALLADPASIEGSQAPKPLTGVVVSGHGEPTNNFHFREAMGVLSEVWRESPPAGDNRLAVLTNGSKTSDKRVRAGLATVAELGAEIWFKLDSATREGQSAINDSQLILRQVRNNLRVATEIAPTWLQTCLFTRDGAPPANVELDAYASFLGNQLSAGLQLAGVQLFTLAAPSAQPGGQALGAAPPATLAAWQQRLAALGLTVEVAE